MRSPDELLFGLLLATYPRDVRRRDGAEMRRTFRERCAAIRRSRGFPALLPHYAREIAGTVAAGFALRRAESASRDDDLGIWRNTCSQSVSDLASGARASSGGPSRGRASRGRAPGRHFTGGPRRPRRPRRFGHSIEPLFQDVRYAVRALSRQKALTAAALVTLALGIGANTAIFSVVYGVLLRPLPYDDPDGIVRVTEEHPGANAPVSGVLSDITYLAWSASTDTLEGISAWSSNSYTLGADEPERVRGASATPELFSLLRVTPALGRFFAREEAVAGAEGVVVIAHTYWQERYGADPDVLGESLVIDERPHTIVGVAPSGFDFPGDGTVLWRPYILSSEPIDAENRSLSVFGAIGRLAPGVTPEQAAAEGTAAARSVTRPRVADLLFGEGAPVEVRVTRLADEMTAEVRPALHVLAVAVGLVLLIACANVANLLLSHGMARRRELIVRSALGASRSRIVRHLLTESLLVAAAGGVAGWALAFWLARAFPVLAPADFPRLDAVQLDGRALLFAVGVSFVAGIGSGLLPALRGADPGTAPALRDAGSHAATDGGGRRLRAGLLAVEAALAVVLVVAASLLLRSFVSMTRVDSGYRPENVLVAQLHFSGSDRSETRTTELVDALLRRLDARSDVVAVAAANMAPFGTATSISGFSIPSSDPDAEERAARANNWVVTPGFADALGLRVTEGRFLGAEDVNSGIEAMVVNEEFVRLFLTDGLPVVGRSYTDLLHDDGTVTEIVGVVANVLKDGPTREPQPEMYVVANQRGRPLDQWVFLFARTSGDPQELAPDLRELAAQVAPRAALDGVGTLSGRLSSSLAQPRFAASVLAAFAVLALVLAATGLYGVMSYSVNQRRREMGIRKALGASDAGLIRLVLRQGLAVVVVGLLIGLAGSVAMTRLMQGLLFGVGPLDGVAFAVAPLVLLLVAALACLLPARRAAASDPVVAMRAD